MTYLNFNLAQQVCPFTAISHWSAASRMNVCRCRHHQTFALGAPWIDLRDGKSSANRRYYAPNLLVFQLLIDMGYKGVGSQLSLLD